MCLCACRRDQTTLELLFGTNEDVEALMTFQPDEEEEDEDVRLETPFLVSC